jgi:hypothetical protein
VWAEKEEARISVTSLSEYDEDPEWKVANRYIFIECTADLLPGCGGLLLRLEDLFDDLGLLNKECAHDASGLAAGMSEVVQRDNDV